MIGPWGPHKKRAERIASSCVPKRDPQDARATRQPPTPTICLYTPALHLRDRAAALRHRRDAQARLAPVDFSLARAALAVLAIEPAARAALGRGRSTRSGRGAPHEMGARDARTTSLSRWPGRACMGLPRTFTSTVFFCAPPAGFAAPMSSFLNALSKKPMRSVVVRCVGRAGAGSRDGRAPKASTYRAERCGATALGARDLERRAARSTR